MLGGPLPAMALERAYCGAADGGLGLRRARDLRFPAFVASRVEAAPLVGHIFDGMAAEGVPVDAARACYDAQLATARAKLEASLDPERRGRLGAILAEGGRMAQERFDAMLSGRGAAHGLEDDADDAPQGGVVGEAGSDDPGHVRTRAVPRLQRRIAGLVDAQRSNTLQAAAVAEAREHDERRVRDLCDASVSHDWRYSLAPTSRHTLEPDVYVDAVRLRLGAAGGPPDTICHVCGRPGMVGGAHALCCAPGPSTRGHNEARDCLLALARRGDPHAEPEALGLLPAAPGLRPADVLTSAAGGNNLVALDVGVASPDSQAAVQNGDGLEAMRKRKAGVYAPVADTMRDSGLEYRPMPWSCWGREHADTTEVLVMLCRRAARRRGEANWRRTLRLFRADICAILARRASAMWQQCALAPDEECGA